MPLTDYIAGVEEPELEKIDGVSIGENNCAHLELRRAVTIEEEATEVSSLTIQEPTARDLKWMQSLGGNELDKTYRVLAKLSGQPPSVIEGLTAYDVTRAGRVLANFINFGSPTSES
jgi:hypothetical protein